MGADFCLPDCERDRAPQSEHCFGFDPEFDLERAEECGGWQAHASGAVILQILEWLLGLIIGQLLKTATSEVSKAVERLIEDRARQKVNEENMKAYEEAKDREARIRAAQALLNGDSLPPDADKLLRS